MPHKRFIKGSPEAISHMQSLRERRKGHKHKTDTETNRATKRTRAYRIPKRRKYPRQKSPTSSCQERKNSGNN